MIESPCYNCKKRKVNAQYNCHTDCAEYLEYKKQLQSLRPEDRQNIYQSYICDAIYRKRKIKNEKNRI